MRKIISLMILIAVLAISCSKDGNQQIKSSGIVDGEIIGIKSQVSGKISKWHFSEGMNIRKDDTLAAIGNEKVLNNIEELNLKEQELLLTRQRLNKKLKLIKANIEHLSKQVDRFKRLSKKSAVTGENLENMELKLLEAETTLFDTQKQLTALDLQKAQIHNKNEYLQLMLADYVIKSPVSGVVLETFVSKGEVVFPRTAIADVLNIAGLFVEVFLEEEEIGSLKLNQEVKILVDGIKDKQFKGIISYFGRKAEFSPKYIISEKERKGLLYQVKVQIKQVDAETFKVGMPVTVVF